MATRTIIANEFPKHQKYIFLYQRYKKTKGQGTRQSKRTLS